MQRLEDSLGQMRAGQPAALAVLMLDIDRFKFINDTEGHDVGDAVVAQVSQRLEATLRSADPCGERRSHIGRFGADQWLVLLQDVRSADEATMVADRLLAQLRQPCRIQGRDVSVTASGGILYCDHPATGPATLVRNAELAMYEARRAGRGDAVLFDEAMHARLARKLAIESGLRDALGTSQLSLVFQPIVDLDSGRRSSVEALVRWTHPALGPVSPGEFVPVAEETGLILPLGEWVVRQSCAALARWRGRDAVRAPTVVSVNVSRVEMVHGARLLRIVREALAETGLPPQSLQLEVTEREVMRDPAASLELMHELRSACPRIPTGWRCCMPPSHWWKTWVNPASARASRRPNSWPRCRRWVATTRRATTWACRCPKTRWSRQIAR
jgi:diguanylate cyclase (GGDEF)-like protein